MNHIAIISFFLAMKSPVMATELITEKKNPFAGTIENFESAFNMYHYNGTKNSYNDYSKGTLFFGTKFLEDKLEANAEFSFRKREKDKFYIKTYQPLLTLIVDIHTSKNFGSLGCFIEHYAPYQSKSAYNYIATTYSTPYFKSSNETSTFGIKAKAEYNEKIRTKINKARVRFDSEQEQTEASALAQLAEDETMRVEKTHTDKETFAGLYGYLRFKTINGLGIYFESLYYKEYDPIYHYIAETSSTDKVSTRFRYELDEFTETTLSLSYKLRPQLKIQLKGYYYNEGLLEANKKSSIIRSAIYYDIL